MGRHVARVVVVAVGGTPFVHVLHTDQRYAVCVDLPYSAVGASLAGTASEVWAREPTE